MRPLLVQNSLVSDNLCGGSCDAAADTSLAMMSAAAMFVFPDSCASCNDNFSTRLDGSMNFVSESVGGSSACEMVSVIGTVKVLLVSWRCLANDSRS